MRDIQILEEWLVKVRQEKREAMEKTLVSASDTAGFVVASHYAHVVTCLSHCIEAIRLLDKDPTEFVKRHLP